MNKMLRHSFSTALFLLAGMLAANHAMAEAISVAAANSTCSAMQQLGKIFEQRTGHTISYQCKASGLLAKGLKGGAISADIYISASKEWMDFMIEAKMVNPEQVRSPWGNQLVVATAKGSSLQLKTWSDLTTPRVTTILIGDPATAPFGRYAKEALQHTALWEQTKSKISTKKHITLLADTLAGADDTTVGILFRSNTTTSHRIMFKIDETWHTSIRYYVAPLKGAAERTVIADFLRFMRGKEAQAIFDAEGFSVHAS